MHIAYTPAFVRQFKKGPRALQEEILHTLELFKDTENHKQLKVHKLKGRFKKVYAFSVNYRIRILFQYEKGEAILLAVGDHSIYS